MPSRSHAVAAAVPTRFATCEAHAALDAAALVGPQPGISHDDILPAAPYTQAELFALAALLPPPSSDGWEGFAEIPLARIDPRAPWRLDTVTGLVADIPRVGFILIYGVGPASGWSASLLHASHDVPGVTEHALVRAKTSRPVRFGDRHEAVAGLRPVVLGRGALPTGWAWSPLLDAPADNWSLLPGSKAEFTEFSWRGRSRWVVTVTRFHVIAAHNRKRVVDAMGYTREFESVEAAKFFCERMDEQ